MSSQSSEKLVNLSKGLPIDRHDEPPSSLTSKHSDSERDTSSSPSSERAFRPQCYHNNLLAAVGWLELANALDFPANVWNEIPAPRFAIILMELGGSIAILFSSVSIWDFTFSRRNVKVLRQEREILHRLRQSESSQFDSCRSGALLIDALLDVNYRELGWEYIDRALPDIALGFAGVLVGAGTLMAIRGDIPVVFTISNLLSGYVGNSLPAAYALINTGWSIYLWRRAAQHHVAMDAVKYIINPVVKSDLKQHAHHHQLYAILTALTAVIAAIGSLISATRWQGYVVLIPCILGSVFCNYVWRHKLGYDRNTLILDDEDYNRRVLQRVGMVVSEYSTSKKGSTRCFGLCTPDRVQSSYGVEGGTFYREKMMASSCDTVPVESTDSGNEEPCPRILLSCTKGFDQEKAEPRQAVIIQCDAIPTFAEERRYYLELFSCYLVRMAASTPDCTHTHDVQLDVQP